MLALLLAGSLSLAAAAAQELFSLVNTPCAADDWNIRRYDAVSGASLGAFGWLSDVPFVEDIEFGPDDSLLVSSHTRVQRYDARTGAYVGELGRGLGFPQQMTWAPDGDLYCTTSAGNVERHGRYDGWMGMFATSTCSGAGGLAFGPDGNLYVTSRIGGRVNRFDGRTGAPLGGFSIQGAPTAPEDLLFGPNGDLYVGDRDAIKVFDPRTGQLKRFVVRTGDVFERNSRLAMRPAIPEPLAGALILSALSVLLAGKRRHRV